MIYPTFIEFSNIKPSCNNKIFTANTIHLKPNSNEVYSFFLPNDFNSINGAFVVDSKGVHHSGLDISLILINGQTVLTVSNIDFDDWDMAYFKFTSVSHDTLYSTPVRISSIDLDKTTYIKYRDNEWFYFGGVRMNLEYWHTKPANEITTYYQVTKEQTISVGSKRQHIDRFRVENVSMIAVTALCDILTYPILYFDGIRTFPYEMPEIDGLQADEDFISVEFMATQNKKDIDNNNVNLSIYVIGNNELNEMIGDGNENIINSNN